MGLLAEINNVNACTEHHSTISSVLLICRDEIYLLDSQLMTRQLYIKVNQDNNIKKVISSSAQYQESVALMVESIGEQKRELMHINTFDSTNTTFPSILSLMPAWTKVRMQYMPSQISKLNLIFYADPSLDQVK